MPDVTWTGGISELKKIGTLAETFYIPLSPHDASGPVNLMAGAQVSINVPNFYRLEARRGGARLYNALPPPPPHAAGGPVSRRAGAQVSINVPNFYRLEARRVALDFYNAFLEEPIQVR